MRVGHGMEKRRKEYLLPRTDTDLNVAYRYINQTHGTQETFALFFADASTISGRSVQIDVNLRARVVRRQLFPMVTSC